MRLYPLVTEVPRHEDVWVSGSRVPRILK